MMEKYWLADVRKVRYPSLCPQVSAFDQTSLSLFAVLSPFWMTLNSAHNRRQILTRHSMEIIGTRVTRLYFEQGPAARPFP